MAFRSVATLSLSFGLVSIPVKVYSATESSAAIRFKLLSRGGQRVRRQYVADEADTPMRQDEADDAVEPAAVVAPGAPTRAGAAAAVAAARVPATVRTPARAGAAARVERAATSTTSDRAAMSGTLSAPLPLDVEAGSEPALQTAPVREPDPEPAPEQDAPARGAVLASTDLVKAYEFEKGRFVTFTAAELKALADSSRPTIDIVSFVPAGSVDPTYYDKAYYLAPDTPNSKPYSLLHAAMQESGRRALARWAWRGKEYVVEIRPAGAGFVLQQLLYADEVRAIDDLRVELAPVGAAELALALRLIEQISEPGYDPHRFVDEEKQRILAAVERKVAGRKIVARAVERAPGAQVIDLIAALRASLGALAPAPAAPAVAAARDAPADERKPARRAARSSAEPAKASAPARRGRQSPQ